MDDRFFRAGVLSRIPQPGMTKTATAKAVKLIMRVLGGAAGVGTAGAVGYHFWPKKKEEVVVQPPSTIGSYINQLYSSGRDFVGRNKKELAGLGAASVLAAAGLSLHNRRKAEEERKRNRKRQQQAQSTNQG